MEQRRRGTGGKEQVVKESQEPDRTCPEEVICNENVILNRKKEAVKER